MQVTRKTVEARLDAADPDGAIQALCGDAAPDQPWHFALLAKAYAAKGDSRGDLYAADFFARRAQEAGFNEPWLAELRQRCRKESPFQDIRALTYEMGGVREKRPLATSPYPFTALSATRGQAQQPRDFHWCEVNVPCQKACPAGTDIPAYLTAIFSGNAEQAYRINLESNVFPGVLGRVCARPCEDQCRHAWDGLGDAVAICFSKRAAADLKPREPVVLDPLFPPTGKHVAIIGSGVAGLAAARELARWGHDVTVLEKHSLAGGMLNQGIPEFRLPREVIDAEIEQIRRLGVRIHCNTHVGGDDGPDLQELLERFDAVIMAAGTLRENWLSIPGSDLHGIRHGLDFLLEANDTGHALVGRHVVVIGGGFTAMDCARTAKRLAAQQYTLPDSERHEQSAAITAVPGDRVKVWYRRTEAEMSVTPGELDELRHEGIDMEFLVSPVRFLGEHGRVAGIEFIRNQLGSPDASGRCRPVPIPGSEFQVPADTVILATGQFPDTAWLGADLQQTLAGPDGWLLGSASHTTAIPKLFAAGDFAQGATSLISSIGHAKKTARAVDTFLMGEERVLDTVQIEDVCQTGRIREMDAVPQQAMPLLALEKRDLCREVERGYAADRAIEETQRCYRCHLKFEIDADKCIYCDWCIKAKPRPECILKIRELTYDDHGRIVGWETADATDDTYLIWINQDDCIRCGACVDACPVDAISLQKVSLKTITKTQLRDLS